MRFEFNSKPVHFGLLLHAVIQPCAVVELPLDTYSHVEFRYWLHLHPPAKCVYFVLALLLHFFTTEVGFALQFGVYLPPIRAGGGTVSVYSPASRRARQAACSNNGWQQRHRWTGAICKFPCQYQGN